MKIRNSLFAAAVVSAVSVPATATAAPTADIYGFIFASVDTNSTDAGGIPNLFAAGANDGESYTADTAESRLGVTGSEDFGNGMTGSYKLEAGIGTEGFGGGGSVTEDNTFSTRLSWVALSDDWGQIKGGTMWGTAYNYSGWNVFRSRAHGGAAYYRMFNGGTFDLTSANPSGLRVDNSIRYTYGSGPYGSDPLTFSLTAQMPSGDNASVPEGQEDDATFDAISGGVQSTFGQVTVNGFFQTEKSDAAGDPREPTVIGVGGRWNNGTTNIGVSFIQTDIDGDNGFRKTTGGDTGGDPRGFIVQATHDFGNDWSGMAMIGTVDGDDAIHDMEENLFLQADYAFSESTHFQAEFEHAALDSTQDAAFEAATAEDKEEQVFSVGVVYNF